MLTLVRPSVTPSVSLPRTVFEAWPGPRVRGRLALACILVVVVARQMPAQGPGSSGPGGCMQPRRMACTPPLARSAWAGVVDLVDDVVNLVDLVGQDCTSLSR